MIDTAVVAYYNFLRVQGWIGNSSLVFEGELFGRDPLYRVHGKIIVDELRGQIERLAEVMIPLQDRCHRMMIRSLDHLPRDANVARPQERGGRRTTTIPLKRIEAESRRGEKQREAVDAALTRRR